MRICNVEGCNSKYNSNGFCKKHNARLMRLGTTELPKSKTFRERFESNIEQITECGCWIWTGAHSRGTGYGKTYLGGKAINAHKASWELHNGIVPDGMWVLHKCDTRLCVNPNHLFLGSHKDNMLDASLKDRYTKKIPNKEVFQIKDMHAYGFSCLKIAKLWGVTGFPIEYAIKVRYPKLREYGLHEKWQKGCNDG